MIQVRYYCLVPPGGGRFLGFDYLEALDRAPLSVRACPIGPAFIADPPWSKLMHLFMGGVPVGEYINVVCAPLGYPLGVQTTGVDFAGSKGDPEVVYRPQTALAGLWTDGVLNVAITLPGAWDEVDSDLRALARYDLVACPEDTHAEEFRRAGVPAFCVPPDAFVAALGAL